MHRYTKAAGFPDFITERDLYEFVERNVAIDANLCKEVNIDSDTYIHEYRLMLNSSIGLCAEFMTVGSHDPYLFTCFPFYDTYEKTSETPCLIERHTEKEVFSGIIDEAEPGISLIFYLTNSLSVRELTECQGAYLAAFANEGKVLLPVAHQEEESELEIYDRIQNEDLYSLVEQTFIPWGVECDQYSIVAEILSVEESYNSFTGIELWLLFVSCNGIQFRICMRKDDLLGEPAPGRRIKCGIWLHGRADI